MKLDYLSASRIKTFEQCPAKYQAIYELGYKDVSGPAALLGTALHKTMEDGVNLTRDGSPVDFKSLANTSCLTYGVAGEDEKLVHELVEQCVRWGYLRDVSRCVGCEVGFSFVLPDGTKVTGRMDRLDLLKASSGAQVYDLKTQKSRMDDLRLKEDWQSVVYNLAARRHLDVSGTVVIAFWVLRHQVQKVWIGPDDALAGEATLMAMAQTIRSCKEPEEKPSKLCPYCPKYGDCEKGRAWIAKLVNN